MSRIGRMPITIPSGVDVTIDGSNITVKGPKGQLSHVVVDPISVTPVIMFATNVRVRP